MVETIMYVLIFIMGAFFGNFYSLAIYRIPLGIDIIHRRSYCPNYKHKLGFLEVIPIFSYIALGGKCKTCGKKIKKGYFIIEILSGLTFLLFALSLNIDFYNLEQEKIVLLAFSYLYFAGLFLIAGIDESIRKILKPVMLYTIIVSSLYILYLYIFQKLNIYRDIIYLIIIALMVILDTLKLRKKGNDSYIFNNVILALIMAMFTGEDIFLISFITMAFSLIVYLLLEKWKGKTKKNVKIAKTNQEAPIAFFMVICNIVIYIIANFIINYNIIL